MNQKWKVRIRQIADREMWEVYRKTKTGEQSEGMFPSWKIAKKIAETKNGKGAKNDK